MFPRYRPRIFAISQAPQTAFRTCGPLKLNQPNGTWLHSRPPALSNLAKHAHRRMLQDTGSSVDREPLRDVGSQCLS